MSRPTGPTSSAWARYALFLPYALLFGVFLLWPVIDGLRLALMRNELASTLPPQFVGLSNFREAFSDPHFRHALYATLQFVVFTTPLTIGFALALALLLQPIASGRRAVYRTLIFMPGLLTVTVVALLWRWLYNTEFGPINQMLEPLGLAAPWLTEPGWAMASIVLMTVWWTVGGPMVILMAALGEIPEEFHEAAAIDGASPLSKLWHVTLPLLKPALLFVVILNLIASFQVFGQTFLVTSGGPENSTRVLVQYIFETTFRGYRLGYGSAMSWLLFVVIAFFSLAQTRLLRER